MRNYDLKSLLLTGLILGVFLAVAPGTARSGYEFIPPEGKTFLFVGQDRHTIDQYVAATKVVPAGVMIYTSIQEVSGLAQPYDNGGGVHDGEYLMRKYPDSSLQIGLYMVNALEGVSQGSYDKNIDKLAKWIRDQKRPVYLRIGYEFDNPQNHYHPQQYILAYKKIVDRFREIGVDNVAFVWHSGAYIAGGPDPLTWYPGADYVDWFAASLFAPAQFEKIKDLSDKAKLRYKPFMIAEASPMGTYSLQSKKEWLDKFFRIIAMVEPQAVCYINSNWDTMPMWVSEKFGDARVEQSPELKEIWLKEIQKDRYIP